MYIGVEWCQMGHSNNNMIIQLHTLYSDTITTYMQYFGIFLSCFRNSDPSLTFSRPLYVQVQCTFYMHLLLIQGVQDEKGLF